MQENGRTNFEQSSLKSRPLWLDDQNVIAGRSDSSNYIFDLLPNYLHTTCKICGNMTFNVTSSY